MVELADQLHRILDRIGTGVRSEIFCFVLFHLPHKQYPRIFLINRHFQIRISFVVLEHRVVLRPVFLDQVTLQHQSLQLGICDDVLKPGDLLHHLFFLDSKISAALKILPDPVFQTDGFPHIDDRIFRIVHNVNSRFSRQFFQFFLYIKHNPCFPFFPMFLRSLFLKKGKWRSLLFHFPFSLPAFRQIFLLFPYRRFL
ncbi:unknown [Blautia sp. CAG:52]|nr:unknown [Blautia sp. CAG:52]